MKLLIMTQVLDRTDASLGFFTKWVEEIANRIPNITVLCLKKGIDVPTNVRICSLGKEDHGVREHFLFFRKMSYALRFFQFIWNQRNEYDTVFVHMNEEYILLGGIFWRLTGKQVYLWRNHYQGSWKTRIAVLLAHRVFCTSRYSYTARFQKTKLMPVGVDLSSFAPADHPKIPHSILFLGRFDESKRPMLLLEALGKLADHGISFSATFVGGPSLKNSRYPEEVRARAQDLNIADRCWFVGAVPSTETGAYYARHEIFVNCSKSGMFDKTMFEAAANGCIVVSSSKDMKAMLPSTVIFREGDAMNLSRVLAENLDIKKNDKERLLRKFSALVERNSLGVLVDALIREMSGFKA